jgi:hypothetical protein
VLAHVGGDSEGSQSFLSALQLCIRQRHECLLVLGMVRGMQQAQPKPTPTMKTSVFTHDTRSVARALGYSWEKSRYTQVHG